MDKVLIKFPNVGQEMFKKLDDQSIAKCRIVSQFQKNFLDNNSLIWKKKVQKYTGWGAIIFTLVFQGPFYQGCLGCSGIPSFLDMLYKY